MTEQQQRIAIASRHLGLRPIKGEKVSDCGHFTMLTADRNHTAFCPDYPKDLNAMHEVENLLTPLQWVSYGRHLETLCDETNTWPIHATAAQRAEAFLKTLNLWKP
jgi:hypothetical protein